MPHPERGPLPISKETTRADRHQKGPAPKRRVLAEIVKLMDGERVVFTEESNPSNYLKLVASGDVDETMLEALEDYVKRQKKRLKRLVGPSITKAAK